MTPTFFPLAALVVGILAVVLLLVTLWAVAYEGQAAARAVSQLAAITEDLAVHQAELDLRLRRVEAQVSPTMSEYMAMLQEKASERVEA